MADLKRASLATRTNHFFEDRVVMNYTPSVSFRDVLRNESLFDVAQPKSDNLYYLDLNSFNIPKMPPCPLPSIASLNDLPPAFQYIHEHGAVFFSPCPNLYIELKVPDFAYPKDLAYSKTCFCRYRDKSKCKHYMGTHCSYVHVGEPITRTVSSVRPSFGTKNTLYRDISKLSYSDINSILLQCVPDLFLVSLWYQNNYKTKKIIFNNIDMYI
jgi:hypothetical protein